ncbi:MAG: hypothetical protein U9M89_00625 [Patescibacteria group bacterium]|nr:hypothetical protein [Patescibacteria group bacterium]
MDGNRRKQDVLKTIVETFVHTGQPVGSLQVVEQLPYEVSSATVRNDMTELTGLDLLSQPHTSAGRIPTDKGYRNYVKVIAEERKELSRKQQVALESHLHKLRNLQDKFRQAARMLAEMSGNIGLLVDDAQNVYVAGLGNVVKLPEFSNEKFRNNLMEVLDQPELLAKQLRQISDHREIKVLIGQDNPRFDQTTVVVSQFGPKGRKVISIIGPTRMDYNKALPLVNHMKKILNDLQS